MAGYDKVIMRKFERGFKAFDRLTALGCQQKGIAYDKQKCQEAWNQYAELFVEQGMKPPQAPL